MRSRREEPLFDRRNTLGCFIENCACAAEPRYHFQLADDETEQERRQRIEDAKTSWHGGR